MPDCVLAVPSDGAEGETFIFQNAWILFN